MPLPDDAFWLLNRIAAGRGNPITIQCQTTRDASLLEALEDTGLIVVGAAPRGWRASIVDKGRAAIKAYRQAAAELVARKYGEAPRTGKKKA